MKFSAVKFSALIPTTGEWGQIVRQARLADELGFESINCSHIAARDSFTTLAALAPAAPRVRLGTAVAPIYHRSPASMAQTAATLDDLSGGRFRLGLGTGHRVTMSSWHGQRIGKPLEEMREYVSVVRALLAGEVVPNGSRWSSTFSFTGFTPRRDIPVYLAGLSAGMIRLAGEIADGIVLWACPASYVRDVVVPEVRAARQAAGKDPVAFDIVAAVPAAATDDIGLAQAGIRAELHRYFGLPFYRTMFASAGYGDDVAAYDAAGERERELAAISDGFIDDLCAIGDADAVTKGLDRFRSAGATNVMITNIRDTDFGATMRAAASG